MVRMLLSLLQLLLLQLRTGNTPNFWHEKARVLVKVLLLLLHPERLSRLRPLVQKVRVLLPLAEHPLLMVILRHPGVGPGRRWGVIERIVPPRPGLLLLRVLPSRVRKRGHAAAGYLLLPKLRLLP